MRKSKKDSKMSWRCSAKEREENSPITMFQILKSDNEKCSVIYLESNKKEGKMVFFFFPRDCEDWGELKVWFCLIVLSWVLGVGTNGSVPQKRKKKKKKGSRMFFEIENGLIKWKFVVKCLDFWVFKCKVGQVLIYWSVKEA